MEYVEANQRQIQIIDFLLEKFNDCNEYVSQPVLILAFKHIIQSIEDQSLILSFVEGDYHAIPLQFHCRSITAIHPKTGNKMQGVLPTLVVFPNISLFFQDNEFDAYISFAECAYKHLCIGKLFDGTIDFDEFFSGFICVMSEITYHYLQKHPEIVPNDEQAQSIEFYKKFTEQQSSVNSLNKVFYNL
jgi:hypothetical protein